MPETYAPGVIYSIRAAGDLPKARFVGFDGNLCAANAKALGVTQYDFAAGEMAGVIVTGIALVEAGGAISAGQAVTSDAEGKAVPVSQATVTISSGTADAVAGTYNVDGGVLPQAVNGWALDAATAAGQVIRVLLAA